MTSDGSRAARGGGIAAAVLAAASAVLAVLVVLLSLQNARLKEALAAGGERAAPSGKRERLEVGDALPSFDLLGPDGRETLELGGGEELLLLLVFAEQCPACPAVVPDWEALARGVSGTPARVVGVRLDPPPEGEGPAAPPAFPVYAFADAREVPLAKLSTVPLTALLDGEGTVLWVRYGDLREGHVEEILGYVGG